MNRFTRPNLRNRIFDSINFSLIFFIAIISVFIVATNTVSNRTLSNEKDILEEALNRDIVHCYSVEGSYPPSLEYIEKKYGLTYDHERFIVDYESIGSNLLPTVTILERKPK